MAAALHLNHPSAIDRPDSRVSLARSDTTYHSFQDVEVYEPEGPSRDAQTPIVCPPPADYRPKEGNSPVPGEMRRQDSGYESLTPRESISARRKTSPSTSVSSSTRQRRSRPSTQQTRSPRPGPGVSPHHRAKHGRHSVSPPGSSRSVPAQPQQQQAVTYFHFPHFTSSDPALVEPERESEAVSAAAILPATDAQDAAHGFAPPARPTPIPSPPSCSSCPYPLPPQTTHYWTSDRTRRLEYAAIDAASKGVRGWVMRHVVPDCFVPRSRRRLGFEDDRGSVVRYRLELESDEATVIEKAESVRVRRWRGWWFSMRRR